MSPRGWRVAAVLALVAGLLSALAFPARAMNGPVIAVCAGILACLLLLAVAWVMDREPEDADLPAPHQHPELPQDHPVQPQSHKRPFDWNEPA